MRPTSRAEVGLYGRDSLIWPQEDGSIWPRLLAEGVVS